MTQQECDHAWITYGEGKRTDRPEEKMIFQECRLCKKQQVVKQ